MFRAFVLILFVIAVLTSAEKIFAQSSAAAQQKTQELVAALAKTKYKHKVKRNFEFERYVDVKNEPIVKNASEYAGVYESQESSHRIELRISANGKIEGSGYETANWETDERQSFTLRDARIDGALLTATKVYGDGRTEKIEAVFVNRTISEGANPNKIESRETRFGLGFVRSFGENSQTRVFCEYKP